jgi:hypothetical protein
MAKPLDLNRLKRFEPSSKPAPAKDGAMTPPKPLFHAAEEARWPSREPVSEGQISIKGSLATIGRFKALCKSDRRTYADMLEILLDNFENKS